MIDVVEKLIRETPKEKYSKGIAAKFLKIDDRWGFKFYENEETRDETYELQQHAHTYGLAPQLGEKFEVMTPDGMSYGYVTEVVEVMVDVLFKKMNITCSHNDFFDLPYSVKAPVYDEAREIQRDNNWDEFIEELEKINIDTFDMHWGNVGWLNGKLVAIDFSEQVNSI